MTGAGALLKNGREMTNWNNFPKNWMKRREVKQYQDVNARRALFVLLLK